MREELIKKLNEIYNECSEIGWDGYDALPISEEIYNECIQFIELLINIPDILIPNIIAEQCNSVGFLWATNNRDMVLIMSIDYVGKISYCIWYESDTIKNRGDNLIIDFNKDSIPKEILEAIYIIDERNKNK